MSTSTKSDVTLSDLADTAKDTAAQARAVASDKAHAALDLTVEKAAQARDIAKSTQKAALASAAALLDDVGARASDASDKAQVSLGRKPKKKRGAKLVKLLAIIAIVAAGAKAFAMLRPKQTPSTGASIPPKVRAVPTRVDDAAESAVAADEK